MRDVLFKLGLGLGLAFSLVAPVLAHGVIGRAEPPVGGAVPVAPTRVKVWFTEPVDPGLSSLEVYLAGTMDRVDLGRPSLEDDGGLVVRLRPDLPQGAYTVAWRVFTPGDGHQTSGTYSFGVGSPALPEETVTIGRTPLGDAVRFLILSGQAMFVGIAIFRGTIQLEDEARFRRALFWLVQFVRVALGLGALGALYVQTQALEVSVLDVLRLQWGQGWLLRAVITGLVIAWAEAWLRGPIKSSGAALLAGGFLLFTTSLTSHSAVQFGLAGMLVDWLHQFGASVWSGGVVCAAIALALGERRFLKNFSILATAAVGLLAASGVWLGSVQVGSWAGLLLTSYGRALLMKLAVAALALGVGAVNALRAPPNWLPLAAIEAGLGLGVILSAALLTNLPPAYAQPTDGAPTRLEQSRTIAAAQLDSPAVEAGTWLTARVVLWPARLGANTVEVRLADARGNPFTGANVRLQFVPVAVPAVVGSVVSDLKLQEIGGGVYSASGTNLVAPGDWQLLLAVDEKIFLNFDYSIGPDAAVRPAGERYGPAVQAVGWLNRYAAPLGAGGLLLSAAVWSCLAWRSLRATATARAALALWLVPGLLLAGAIWLWIKLNF